MTRVPDYYDRFRCLAGSCPHSCCEAWDVVLDEKTAERYRRVEGPLGEKLRESMTEEEGEMCFSLRGGRCPFLDEDNLCEIHRTLGEEATSETCRSHPRFIEEYEGLKEITLSVSCPAANELLLGEKAPLRFVVTKDGGGEMPEDLAPLYALRERALEGLGERSLPLKSRLQWLLALAIQAQALLDEGEEEALLDLAQAAPGELDWELEEREGSFLRRWRLWRSWKCWERTGSPCWRRGRSQQGWIWRRTPRRWSGSVPISSFAISARPTPTATCSPRYSWRCWERWSAPIWAGSAALARRCGGSAGRWSTAWKIWSGWKRAFALTDVCLRNGSLWL